eukprot:TRINITY_DN975_c0_g1_i1.p1 TRINITY_DN975_c0_g1~~TRINITY_DN975_c0_g1_i1.p1  ORF type:complete len:177 (+),score=28.94 TRINITY_DN975_c0_g1_i1:971-1501(+)
MQPLFRSCAGKHEQQNIVTMRVAHSSNVCTRAVHVLVNVSKALSIIITDAMHLSRNEVPVYVSQLYARTGIHDRLTESPPTAPRLPEEMERIHKMENEEYQKHEVELEKAAAAQVAERAKRMATEECAVLGLAVGDFHLRPDGKVPEGMTWSFRLGQWVPPAADIKGVKRKVSAFA